jgi:hypothetical protein
MLDIDAPPDEESEESPPSDNDLARRLDLLHEEAEAWLHTPLRAHSEFQRGFLETVARDNSGLCWVSGWMQRDAPLEFAAVILDRHKFPAAVALTSYPRDDLPGEAHAVIGAIRTPWRPSGPDADAFLFFGEEMRFYQRAVKPLRLLDPRDAIEQFERVRAHCTGTLTPALQRLVASPDNWLPDSARAAGFPAHAAVDRLMMLPGFGCLAEGWAMSPVKRLQRLALKCGPRILHADPLATYFRPRHDLREAFPNCGGSVTDRAGFVAVFRGRIEPADFVDPLLKVVFSDGTSSNHAVTPAAMRQIGHSAMPEDVLSLFPSLLHETFFGDFARALRRDAAQRLGTCDAWTVRRVADRVVVVALPRDRSDVYLMFEEMRHLLARLPDPPGFVFLAERGTMRPDVLTMFQGVAEAAGDEAGCSLFFIDDADHALHLAGRALRAVGARRFLFVGSRVALSPEGWRRGIELLAAARPGGAVQILGLEAGTVAASDPAAPDCFVWTAEDFLAVLPHLPIYLGGRHMDGGLSAAGVEAIVHPGLGFRTDGGRSASPLMAAINATPGTQGTRRDG